MARNKTLEKKRNDLIRARYHELRDKKTKQGARIHSEEFIFEKLVNEFHLTYHTLRDIVFYKKEKTGNQPDLFS